MSEATPRARVDLDVLERNAERMSRIAARHGVRLRPHVKTHKCVEAARIQTRAEFGGITVSTLAEAEAFAAGGFRDITYAIPFPVGAVERAVERAARVAERVDALTILVDHADTVRLLDESARERDVRFTVLIELDCGDHRSGVDPDRRDGLDLARAIAESPGLDLEGVLTHAGHAYAGRGPAEIRRVAGQERDVAVAFAERLRSEGHEVRTVSVGSTPTAVRVDHLEGVTEIRPGNYLFFDAFQAAIGSCRLEDVAFSVVATVVGSYPARQEAVVNAGALALSKDPGPTHVDPDCGFGVVVSGADGMPLEDVRVASVTQEHGVLRGPGAGRLEVGSTVRILPNHACLAAAGFGRLEVVRDGGVVDEWEPVRGW